MQAVDDAPTGLAEPAGRALNALRQGDHDPQADDDDKPASSAALLMAAALALPGMVVPAVAQEAGYNPQTIDFQYNRAYYLESDDRVNVTENRYYLSVPLSTKLRAGALLHFTEITGASPFAVRPDPSGVGEQLIFDSIGAASMPNVTSVTGNLNDLQEDRIAVEGDFRYIGDRVSAGVTLGYTTENDYVARYFSLDLNTRLNTNRTTVFVQAALSDDTLTASFSEPNFNEDKLRYEVVIGASHVMNKNTVAEVSVGYSRAIGFLGDPHKGVWITDQQTAIREDRPETREHLILFGQVRQFIPSVSSALFANYRFTTDSWDTNSHTIATELRTDLPKNVQVSTGLRYYTQSDADFYQPFFTNAQVTAPGASFSSDFRLAAFGALSPSFEVSKALVFDEEAIESIRVRAYYQRYIRRADLSISGGQSTSADDFNANAFGVSLEGVF